MEMGISPVTIIGPVVTAMMLSRIMSSSNAANEVWPLERPEGMPTIQSLEVMCGKDHMDVHLQFSQPFEGIVSSKGQYGDPRCVYVPPSTGKTYFTFRIGYARCGTKPDLNGQFYENTVVVQYDKDLLEVWDEAKRLRCEWYNDYEKTASKPPMVIADLDVIQLDFRGDNVDCWMEIQHGKGPWAPPVSGIVPLGSTLTLVVAINDYRGEFDMRVKSCAASDGDGHIIQLSDEHGCVLRPKMISRFLKAKISDERASVITYAFFHAFKFPDALSVHIKCKVEICRHGCPDHCQLADLGHVPVEEYNTLQRKDTLQEKLEPQKFSSNLFDDVLDNERDQTEKTETPQKETENSINLETSPGSPEELSQKVLPPAPLHRDGSERFPHGPRKLKEDAMAEKLNGSFFLSGKQKRRRRSFVVQDSKGSNANIGVSGLYEVVSQADLAFTPDSGAEAVAVFQGRIREEVVYGICVPLSGFSAMFLLMAVSVMTSALIAGFLMYKYQIHAQTKQQQQRRQKKHAQCRAAHVQPLASWMAFGLIKNKTSPPRTIIGNSGSTTNHNS